MPEKVVELALILDFSTAAPSLLLAVSPTGRARKRDPTGYAPGIVHALVLLLVLTFLLAVVFDLVVAIAVGLAVHYAIVLIKRMAKK